MVAGFVERSNSFPYRRCNDAPCTLQHGHNDDHLVNEAFHTELEARQRLMALYAKKGYFGYRKKENDFICLVAKCQTKFRIRKTKRIFEGNSEAKTCYAILGCTHHNSHQMNNGPLRGYCKFSNDSHQHNILEMTFENESQAMKFIKEKVFQKVKERREEKRKTLHITCNQIQGCTAEIHLHYPNGTANEIYAKGCTSHRKALIYANYMYLS